MKLAPFLESPLFSSSTFLPWRRRICLGSPPPFTLLPPSSSLRGKLGRWDGRTHSLPRSVELEERFYDIRRTKEIWTEGGEGA